MFFQPKLAQKKEVNKLRKQMRKYKNLYRASNNTFFVLIFLLNFVFGKQNVYSQTKFELVNIFNTVITDIDTINLKDSIYTSSIYLTTKRYLIRLPSEKFTKYYIELLRSESEGNSGYYMNFDKFMQHLNLYNETRYKDFFEQRPGQFKQYPKLEPHFLFMNSICNEEVLVVDLKTNKKVKQGFFKIRSKRKKALYKFVTIEGKTIVSWVYKPN